MGKTISRITAATVATTTGIGGANSTINLGKKLFPEVIKKVNGKTQLAIAAGVGLVGGIATWFATAPDKKKAEE